ncbi:GGDEF domain-containing protein [Klebsiella quasipneumoniae]|uniref:GGDEF domain-containing protein n=1 Tax=Klebsiella quasipneumoniae TaxID=1463165 RepID=UPI002B052A5E|nr:diguanylate cyclase [Klebsiella quasipneumoniae]
MDARRNSRAGIFQLEKYTCNDMKNDTFKYKKNTIQPVNVRFYLWGSTVVTLVLTSLLSWWLLSSAWSGWHNAGNNILQFNNFYHVLQVSNDLASERAFAHELILSDAKHKAYAGVLVDKSRNKTDHDLKSIPRNLLSPVLIAATLRQLTDARFAIDRFRKLTINDSHTAQQAIDRMIAATDFYHQALFRHTSEFLLLDSSALGPILHAQALGELRDATGRLGAQVIIPLATKTPLTLNIVKALSQGKERINVLWWLMNNYGPEEAYMPGFRQLLAETRNQFEIHGLTMLDTIATESGNNQPYSLSAKDFAVSYHASLKSFNELLDTYLLGIEKYYDHVESQALIHLITVSVILIVLYLTAFGTIFLFRNHMLNPIIHLNKVAGDIISGKQTNPGMSNTTAEEVYTLFTSLGALDSKLREQKNLSEILQRQSEEDPLTQLYNRRAFDTKTNDLLQNKNENMTLWLFMVDVDHFKKINDTWGHPTGDDVLVQLATILKKFSRPGDIIGRLGGEEFAVAFTANHDRDVIGYVTRIQNEIRRQTFEGPKGELFSVTASFGLASDCGQKLGDILARADAALYDAKNSGRDRLCGEMTYSPLINTPRCLATGSVSVKAE